MTTLRRELIQVIKEAILKTNNEGVHLEVGYDGIFHEQEIAEIVADEVLKLRAFKPLDKEKILAKASPEWAVLAGQKIQEEQAEEEVDKYTEIWNATGAFERDMRFNPLPWNTNDDWTKFQTFVVEQYRIDPEIFFKYKSWQLNEGKYQALSNKQIKANPKNFIDCFPDFLAHASMNSKKETMSTSRNLNG